MQTTKTSVHGAINMLGLAKRVKAKRLQASTSEVYGDPEVRAGPGCLNRISTSISEAFAGVRLPCEAAGS